MSKTQKELKVTLRYDVVGQPVNGEKTKTQKELKDNPQSQGGESKGMVTKTQKELKEYTLA